MFVTKRKHVEGLEKEYKRGLQVGTELLERRVDEAREGARKEGYNIGFSDRVNYYTGTVIPEKNNKIIDMELTIGSLEKELETYKKVTNNSLTNLADTVLKKNEDLQELERYIRALEKQEKEYEEEICNFKNENTILWNEFKILSDENNGLKIEKDLLDLQEIKRLEALKKKVKRVKVKKKIQSRIDKLMVRGL